MNRSTKKKIHNLKQNSYTFSLKKKPKSKLRNITNTGGFNKSNLAKAAVAATGVAAATYAASQPEIQETLQHFKDKIIDNITQSSLSNLFSSYAYIFSPFGSSDIFINAKMNKFESKFLTPCQDKDYFYNDVKKSDWDFSIQGLKNKFISFLNELKNNNLTYSRKDISRLSRIQKISNISQIYSLNESIEDYLQTIQLDNLNTSLISELVKSFYPNYAQQEFEINTKYWLCLQSKYNNLLFIPVIIKRHLFSYHGIYLNSLKNAIKVINQSNLQNLDDPYPIEFPYYNFIMDLPAEVKINSLLVPCYSSIPNKITNLSNIQDLISGIVNDINNNFLDDSDLDTLEKVQTFQKEDIKITESIQYISQHPEIFEKKSFDNHQSFLHSPPFLFENLLDLFLAPSWIDKYVVNRCYNFWIQFQYKKLINISDFHQIKELNSGLSNIYKISPEEVDQLKITDLDIIPCIWTNSKTFQHLVTTVLVGLAATTFLNKTETGKTIKNKVLKPVINQVKEYVSPTQPVLTDISIPKKEGLFKKTMKKIKEFSPFKKFMSKGGQQRKRSHTLKNKKRKN